KALKINGKTAVVADNGLKIAEFNTEIQVRKGVLPLPPPEGDKKVSPPEGERRGVPLWRGIKGEDAYFDYDKLQLPLLVRNFRPGDKFAPLGMKGRKKLKDLFIEKKIPKRRRGLIPILVSGDEIIWVVGIRQAVYGKIEPETKKILKIEMQ
ncbi:MAG: tRNA lysidine(34) synthetase TilS, partial [Deltaproteobacteria bacterium]|nr:tRNA lysidine(34) synthetase TilS [Deltaproteobacteria bacterium]